jgi:hypothetical protein
MKYVKAFESKKIITEENSKEVASFVDNLMKISGSFPEDVTFKIANPPTRLKGGEVVYNPNGIFLPGHGRVNETVNLQVSNGYGTSSIVTCSSYTMAENMIKLYMMEDAGLSTEIMEWLEESYMYEDISWEEGIQELIKEGPIEKLSDKDFEILGIDKARLRGKIGGKRLGLL